MAKIMKKMMKTSLIITSFALVIILLYVVIFEALYALDTTIAHNNIEKYGIALAEDYIYIDEDELSSAEPIETILTNIPEPIVNEIKDNWIILVAENPPDGEYDASVAVGITYIRAKVIWLAPDFTDRTLVHEIGHAIASLQNLDMSNRFAHLYNLFWDKCYEWTYESHDSHDVSTPSEFFALLFEQYILHPDDLKENFKDGYDYIDNVVKSFDTTFVTTITNPFIKTYNLFSYGTRKLSNSGFSLSSLANIDNKVKKNPLIDVDTYESSVEFAGLRTNEKALLNMIMDVIARPENYSDKYSEKDKTITIEIEENVTFAMYNKVAACVDYYFGEEVTDVVDIHSFGDTATIVIHMDKLTELQQARDTYISNVETALSGMHEGTETQKLLQISKYIIDNCEYEALESTSANDFWTHGKGDCVTYSMVFRQFCERLGIQCDIIYGITRSGAGHVWNRVKLSDGSYRYYDLTYYQIGAVNIEQYDRHTVLAMNSYHP